MVTCLNVRETVYCSQYLSRVRIFQIRTVTVPLHLHSARSLNGAFVLTIAHRLLHRHFSLALREACQLTSVLVCLRTSLVVIMSMTQQYTVATLMPARHLIVWITLYCLTSYLKESCHRLLPEFYWRGTLNRE